MRAAREHLLVSHHDEAECEILVGTRPVIALSQIVSDFLVERQLVFFKRHRHRPRLAGGEAADLGLAVPDQGGRQRVLADQHIHQVLAFLIVGQQRDCPGDGDAEVIKQFGAGFRRGRLICIRERIPADKGFHQRVQPREETAARVVGTEGREQAWLHELDQGVKLERMDLHRRGRQQEQTVDKFLQLVR